MSVVVLGNVFLFRTKWVPVYTHCVTPSQEDVDIRCFYSYELYLGIYLEGQGMG